MNILQFESLNLKFICKRYEKTSFGIQNTKFGLILRLNKRLGLFLQNYWGLRENTRDYRLNLRNLRGYLTKLPREGVSADLNRTIANERP
jgi:hypothetical protein